MYVETLPTKWHSKIQIFNRPWLDQTLIYKQEMYDFLGGVLLAILLKIILIVILWSFCDKNLIFMVIL